MATEGTVVPPAWVVGIGASAGGLDALSALLDAVPDDLDACLIVAQHVSPSHRSMLRDILSRRTRWRVLDAEEGLRPERGLVYVVPPNVDLAITGGFLSLQKPRLDAYAAPSINRLFEELGNAFGPRAVAIVLSGSGGDGSRGAEQLKRRGGLVFVQDPVSAAYASMPAATLATTKADVVGRPEEFGAQLARFELRRPLANVDSGSAAAPSAEQALTLLLAALRGRGAIDFSHYRRSTLLRRVARRMQARDCASIEQYVQLTERDAVELDALRRDLLISVTDFFRDSKAFAVLRQQIRQLVQQRGEELLRVWCAGCASGEEAYTLAMLFAEEARERKRALRVSIFATDVDEEALGIGRRGIYSEDALSIVPPELCARYFDKGDAAGEADNRRRVIKSLREMVVFARHDVTTDAPFLRMDLILCRNLLIYFDADLQQHTLERLATSLNPGGLLMLGRAERVQETMPGFEPVDKRQRIYRRVADTKLLPAARMRAMQPLIDKPMSPSATAHPLPAAELDEAVAHTLLDQYRPPTLVVDARNDVVQIHGDVTPFVSFKEGRASLSALKLVVPPFRNEVAPLLHLVRTRRMSALGMSHELLIDGEQRWIRLAAHPVSGTDQRYVLCFERQPLRLALQSSSDAQAGPAEPAGDLLDYVHQLEDNLETYRSNLEQVIENRHASDEELQAVNEELQATNEELEATNEELQAASEELQAANEELQATNEELSLVNEELSNKSAELKRTVDDLTNVQESVGFPLLLLDCKGSVLRANSTATRRFVAPLGKPLDLEMVERQLGMPPRALLARLEQLLATGTGIALPVETADGRCFDLRLAPYHEVDGTDRISGAVLTLHDHTELVHAQRSLQAEREKLEAILNASPVLTTLKDVVGHYLFANAAFLKFFGLKLQQVLGKTDQQLFRLSVAQVLQQDELEVLRSGQPMESEQQISYADVACTFRVVRFPLRDLQGVTTAVCTKYIDVTQQAMAQHAVAEREALLSTVTDSLNITIVVVAADGRIIFFNRAWQRFAEQNGNPRMSGCGVDSNYLEACRPSVETDRYSALAVEGIKRVIDGREGDFTMVYPCHAPHERRWFMMRVNRFEGQQAGAVISHTNITARLANEEQHRLATVVFEYSNDPILVANRKLEVVSVNGAYERMTGYRAGDVLSQPVDRYIGRLRHRQDNRSLWRTLRREPHFVGQAELALRSGAQTSVSVSVSKVQGLQDDELLYVVFLRDVSEQVGATKRLAHIAYHDVLTGLPNRLLCMEHLNKALLRAKRRQAQVALFFIDLNRFKFVNDTYGHAVGDELLSQVSARLRDGLREEDVVARLSGDEFVVIMENVSDKTSVEQAAAKMLSFFAEPFSPAGKTLYMAASIGVATYPHDAQDAEGLLRCADSAMYRAKKRNVLAVEIYADDMSAVMSESLRVETGLRDGSLLRELEVHYQPVLRLADRKVVALEALVRWRDPQRGLIGPDHFIAAAESCGRIVALGEFVLDAALAQLRRWHGAGLKHLRMSVNVSPIQLVEGDLSQVVEALLRKHELQPAALMLEITESAFAQDGAAATKVLEPLRTLGVQVALDDFGTRYSNFERLRTMPVDCVKIDRSFVADIERNPSLVDGLMDFARRLQLQVIAEGVESDLQLAQLRSSGCETAQGYLFSRPLPAADLDELLLVQRAPVS